MSAGAVANPGPIRDLLSQPQVLRLFGSSMVGRLPMGAIGLVLILHVREVTGSYGIAGGHGIMSGIAPAGSITEAFSWAATAFGAGFAIGGGLGGARVESIGPGAGFALATVSALLAAAIAAVRRLTLMPSE